MRKLFTLALVCLLLLAVGCDQSSYHKAAQAAATISTSLKAVQQVNASLYADGLLTPDETIAVATEIGNVNVANLEFTAKLKTLTKFDASNQAVVVAWMGELAASVQKLSDQGALHVKNPAAKTKLALTISAIQAAMQILQTAVK